MHKLLMVQTFLETTNGKVLNRTSYAETSHELTSISSVLEERLDRAIADSEINGYTLVVADVAEVIKQSNEEEE